MNALTVLVKIKPGKVDRLKKLLTDINSHQSDNELMLLQEDRLTHCSRWAIIEEENDARLLLACEFDGDLDGYLEHLVDITPGLGDIWGCCEGYGGKAEFVRFIRANAYPTQAFYIAFRDETVASIRKKIDARERLGELLDRAGPAAKHMLAVLALLPPPRGPWRRLCAGFRAARQAFHQVWMSLALTIVRPLSQIGETRSFPRVTSTDRNPLTPRAQALRDINGQMITITTIKPGLYWLVHITFLVNEFLGKYGWAPGQFADVGTLHSFRWVLIDNKKRLIFLSVFDGSWQNYMGDFIDKIIWALDGVYKNTLGYPKAGMKEVVQFQRWILNHQYEPQLFYRAYPKETVLNLIRDRTINDTLATALQSGRIDSDKVRTLLQTL